MRGGEKCLEVLCELYPDATVFTLLHSEGSVSETIENMAIRTSFVQRIPFSRKRYRTMLPLFPTAIETFDLRAFDLVISSSHCVAKGVIPREGSKHICYCYTPMRYVWAMYEEYFGPEQAGRVTRTVAPLLAKYLRRWDVASSQRVDTFVAISENVRRRILRYYGRESEVIFPPVAAENTWLSGEDDGYFLVVSAFAPYKKVEHAIAAFNEMNEKLVVIGTGQQEKKLKKMARGNIEFLGWVGSDKLWQYYAGCRALIFPGEEDFGIVPLEAQCFGKPVIAFGRGGVLETVRGQWLEDLEKGTRGKHTGIFYRAQTPQQLMEAVRQSARLECDHQSIREHALQFDRAVFKKRISEFITRQVS
jgi:glycosyltransferase involved in cell wall biosynthesis